MALELSESSVQSALSTRWLGRTYYHFDTVGSTNVALQELVAAGSKRQPPSGTVVLAEYQSRGRGRLDRRWLAPQGSSLLLSVLLRPHWPLFQAHWLTMIASLAAAESIETMTRLSIRVKWPNDLMISARDVWHKFGGILLEGITDAAGQLESAIIGIGINGNIPANELPETAAPTTSLMLETRQPVSRLDLLIGLLDRLEALYEAADRGQSPQPAWKERLITLGQKVRLTPSAGAEPWEGTAEDVDSWGQLLVRDERGELRKVSAGDVSLRR